MTHIRFEFDIHFTNWSMSRLDIDPKLLRVAEPINLIEIVWNRIWKILRTETNIRYRTLDVLHIHYT